MPSELLRDWTLAAVIAIPVAILVVVALRAMNGWRPVRIGDLGHLRPGVLVRGLVAIPMAVARFLGVLALSPLAAFSLFAIGAVVAMGVLWFYHPAAKEFAEALTHPWVFWVYAGVVLVFAAAMARQRYRTASQQAMLSTLAVAAQRGIPLPSALRALAAGRWGLAARKMRRVATSLESGAALPDAMTLAAGLIPRQAMLKIRLGQALGELPQTLREAGQTDAAADSTRAQWSGKLAYLTLLAIFMAQLVLFVMLKIAPGFEKIFKDFHIDLPAVTRSFNSICYATGSYGYLWIVPSFLLLLYVLAWTIAGFESDFPVLSRVSARLDTAAILESLALVTARQRPLTEGILTLAMHYPKRRVRRGLAQVFTAIHAGADWIGSLRAEHLIRPGDAAILRAAERAGNLTWALREMAESNRRRFDYRMYVCLQGLFPLLVLLVGSAVALFAAAYFIPLIAMITRLAV